VKTVEYTHNMFIAAVSMTELLKNLYQETVSACGLPKANVLHENISITAILRDVIREDGLPRKLP